MTSSSRWRGLSVAAVASALACVLAVAVGPSFSKNDKGDPGTGGSVEQAATTDAGSSDAPGNSGSAPGHSKDSGTSAPSASASSGGSTSSGTGTSSSGNADGSNGKGHDKYDPDPPGQNTPPATTGPGTCSGYDQGSGSYDHDNCDGTQGQHGNGGNGKCAGCTGKADDKSPGGQHPGDHNNGYECDNNGGVGKGNPAHSKCPTQTPPCVDDPNTSANECNPPTPCVDKPNTPKDECNPGETCPPGTDMAGEPIPPGGVDKCDDEVLGGTLGDIDGDKDDEVLGRRVPNPPPPGAVMPFTGTSVIAYVLVGLQMIGAGALIARSRRRK